MDKTELKTFIQKLPKAELHVHLEGAIAPDTVLELAQRHKMTESLPAKEVAGLKKWFAFSDFDHFVQLYVTIQNLLRTPEDFALIAYRLGADMARQNILYREATFTPYTHLVYQDKGLTIEDVFTGLDRGRQQAQEEFGVEIRWVFDMYRNLSFLMGENGQYDPSQAEKTLEYAIAGLEHGVVGIGIGGSEVGAPASAFQHAFLQAKQAGLLSLPHAGENMGPESVWESVKDLQADRIGHGVRAIEDEKLVRYLAEHTITLEVNPTSNLRLHVYDRIEDHPFRKLDEKGVYVTINSDDPPLFNTDLNNEYLLVAQAFGYSPKELVRLARNAFIAAGADLEVKQNLLLTFEEQAGNLLSG